jgi:hypothetical protein
MERQQLQELVEEGLTVRAIGLRVGKSPTAVRHWLARYGLSTERARRRRGASAGRAEHGIDLQAVCPRHGITRHRARADSGIACLRCRSEAVVRRRRRLKRTLVEEAGGRCRLCGYDRSPAALVFHHVDPTTKRFGLARGGMTRSLARAREEARKCLLLCANCHAEVEAGVTTLPRSLVEDGPG